MNRPLTFVRSHRWISTLRALLCTALALLLLLLPLGGCQKQREDGKLTVICTVFPIYDWVRQIVGTADSVEPILLASNGTDLHSYQPTAADMVRLTEGELVIRVGGSSDRWVVDMLNSAPREDRRELVLSDNPNVTLRQIAAESIAQDHDHEDHEGHEAQGVTDEHIWLSVKNAIACVAAITDALCAAAPDHEATFRGNAAAYEAQLAALDKAYGEAAAHRTAKGLVFADRFPFVYLTEDYQIPYLAAFEGCSTDTDASFDTIVRLANRLDEWGLAHVCVTETANPELARAVLEASSNPARSTVTLNALQAVGAEESGDGLSYLSVMEANLVALRTALGSNGSEQSN